MNRRDFLKGCGTLFALNISAIPMPKVKHGDMPCDACGKDMFFPNKEGYFCGVQIEVIVDDVDEPSMEWYIEQMQPYKINYKYHVCFPCWLKSLGVTP